MAKELSTNKPSNEHRRNETGDERSVATAPVIANTNANVKENERKHAALRRQVSVGEAADWKRSEE